MIRRGCEVVGNGEFWRLYYLLPERVRAQSRQAYGLFMINPDHPSLRFKKLNGPGNFWSVRFGGGYRAVGRRDGENIILNSAVGNEPQRHRAHRENRLSEYIPLRTIRLQGEAVIARLLGFLLCVLCALVVQLRI